VLGIYSFVFGTDPDVARTVQLYHDVKEKLSEADDENHEKELMIVAKKILVVLNGIVINLMKNSSVLDATNSRAIQSFKMKNDRELSIINNVFDFIFAEIPRCVVNENGEFKVHLFSLFDEVDAKKPIINMALRDIIVNGMIDGSIPDWVETFLKINHLVEPEIKELFRIAKQRITMFQ